MWDCLRGYLEICGIVLEIQGSSQALGIIWEGCGVVEGQLPGADQGKRTDFSTSPTPLLLVLHDFVMVDVPALLPLCGKWVPYPTTGE